MTATIRLKALAILVALTAISCTGTGTNDTDTQVTITVNAGIEGPEISPDLYGLFFEEINHAGDGGLYAELIRNRDFEASSIPEGMRVEGHYIVNSNGWKQEYEIPFAHWGWALIEDKGSNGIIRPESSNPVSASNPNYLRMTINKPKNSRVGLANGGYWGIAIEKGASYRVSFYARCDEVFDGNLTVSLESEDGTVYGINNVEGVSEEWQQFESTITVAFSDPKARFVIAGKVKGTVWFDMISLFPSETFKNRPNGMRKDLAEKLEALKPSFFRFPGGCVVEGASLENRFQWKKTIGPLTERPGHWNLWNYHWTDGMGYHEYLQFCEDLNAAPMYICNVGLSCQARGGEIAPEDALESYIQDVLDAIEYANGPVSSKWGAERASNGHPKPFDMKYLGIGNENHGPVYHENYQKFMAAIKAVYPDMLTIACENHPDMGAIEIIDEHYYMPPHFFYENASRYDSYDRNGPKIFVGEYACHGPVGNGNLLAAVAEAAFMTGMERNSDVVVMAAYAPLLVNVNDRKWNPDLIGFDSASSYGTPSYYVQQMFAANKPDIILKTTVEMPAQESNADIRHGRIGLSTYEASAEFADIEVTKDGEVLFSDDFTEDNGCWQTYNGNWGVKDGVYAQDGDGQNTFSFTGDLSWTDYTLTCRARKTGGREGFMLAVYGKDNHNNIRWNVGGWGNTRHAVQFLYEGNFLEYGTGVAGSVETGRWYDVKVEVKGDSIKCYLDGELIHDVTITDPAEPEVYAVSGRSRETNEIIIKVVNATSSAQSASVNITGSDKIEKEGTVTVLSSPDPTDENSIEEPTKVSPKTETIKAFGTEFTHSFPANSVTVFRLREKE